MVWDDSGKGQHTQMSQKNDHIVCLAILNNSCHISVCKFDIGRTNTIDFCR